MKDDNALNIRTKKELSAFDFLRNRRYVFYILLTIILLVLPFIRINGNHIFLLSFERQELHLLGVSFHVQELYLLPFLLIILFVGIFFVTTLGGRIWCGWGCPQTLFRVIFRDLLQTKILKLRRNINNKQQKIKYDSTINIIKYAISIIIFAFIAIIASANFLLFFTPPEDFLSYILVPSEHGVLYGFWIIITLIMIADICFIAENFCIYMCPYARVQSVLFDNDTIMSIYNIKRGGAVYSNDGMKRMYNKNEQYYKECINCNMCVSVCPTHIDIRKGMQLECINCLECADACKKTMAKLGKSSLITWSSPNALGKDSKIAFIRPKTIGYIAVLCIIVALLCYRATTKEGMLLNINRSTELYQVRDDGSIDNAYKLLLQNTDNKDHIFRLSIDSNDFEFIRPVQQDIAIKANESSIIVAVLRAKNKDKAFANDEKIPIKIKSYAIDNEKEIFAVRDTFFMYPSKDFIIKKSQNH